MSIDRETSFAYNKIVMIANIITISRILFSFCLFVLSPSSPAFALFYILCGVSDMLDGFIARKLHTESRTGEILDSVADLFFAAAYVVIILPLLSVPLWIWIWIALIAIAKIFGIVKASKRRQKFHIAHSFANKLTGFLIFVLPLTVHAADIKYSAAIVCAVATFAAAAKLLERRNSTTAGSRT